MREDMAKVIVERPRRCAFANNKPKGYRKRLGRTPPEDWPHREGMKLRWGNHTKEFNEHLAPLRRFLDSRLGHLWDDVFAEICQHLRRDSVIQDHVRDHVEDFVTRDVMLVEGRPCYLAGWQSGRPLWPGQRYVCPRTGRLKKMPDKRKRPAYRPGFEWPPPRGIRVSATLQCRRINGLWHVVELRPFPVLSPKEKWDVVLNRRVTGFDKKLVMQMYGALVYAVSARRLAKRELSQYPIPRDQWR